MSINCLDDDTPDEFFAGRIPARRIPRGNRHAGVLLGKHTAPVPTHEPAIEDQVVIAFMDTCGSVWANQARSQPQTFWLTVHRSRWLCGGGRHVKSLGVMKSSMDRP